MTSSYLTIDSIDIHRPLYIAYMNNILVSLNCGQFEFVWQTDETSPIPFDFIS